MDVKDIPAQMDHGNSPHTHLFLTYFKALCWRKNAHVLKYGFQSESNLIPSKILFQVIITKLGWLEISQPKMIIEIYLIDNLIFLKQFVN